LTQEPWSEQLLGHTRECNHIKQLPLTQEPWPEQLLGHTRECNHIKHLPLTQEPWPEQLLGHTRDRRRSRILPPSSVVELLKVESREAVVMHSFFRVSSVA
jgi:hypothetical protein